MKKSELKKIVTQVQELEEQCQQGINVPENLVKMEEIMIKLSFEDMLELTELLNKKFLTK